jgi:hypothetical protein
MNEDKNQNLNVRKEKRDYLKKKESSRKDDK